MQNSWTAYLQQSTRQLLSTAMQAYGRNFPMPAIHTDLRGMTAGQAFVADNRIRLNTQLLTEHGQAFIDETLPHELAHLVVYQLYGRRARPHGEEWKAVMALFGAKADRCHSYTVQPARQVATYRYYCNCREHEISAIRHRRVAKGRRYVCRSCGETLYRRKRSAPATRSAPPAAVEQLPLQLPLPL